MRGPLRPGITKDRMKPMLALAQPDYLPDSALGGGLGAGLRFFAGLVTPMLSNRRPSPSSKDSIRLVISIPFQISAAFRLSNRRRAEKPTSFARPSLAVSSRERRLRRALEPGAAGRAGSPPRREAAAYRHWPATGSPATSGFQ